MHHSKKVSQFLLDNRIDVIYNVIYCPQYNPIERIWAQIKLLFKKQKMANILEGRASNYKKMIREAMDTYPGEKISSICKGTMRSQMGV